MTFSFKTSDSLSEQTRGSAEFASPDDQLRFSSLFTSMASSVSISISFSFSGTRLVLDGSTLGTGGGEGSEGISVLGEGAEVFLLTVVAVAFGVIVVLVVVVVGKESLGSLGMLGGEKGDSVHGRRSFNELICIQCTHTHIHTLSPFPEPSVGAEDFLLLGGRPGPLVAGVPPFPLPLLLLLELLLLVLPLSLEVVSGTETEGEEVVVVAGGFPDEEWVVFLLSFFSLPLALLVPPPSGGGGGSCFAFLDFF